MSHLGRPRELLASAIAAWQQTQRRASDWSDESRRAFDRRTADPAVVEARQYARTLDELDADVQRALRLLDR